MKQKLTIIVVIASLFLLSSVSFQPQKADRVVGTYYVYKPETKSESKVQVSKTKDGKYEGKIIWLKRPNNPDGTPKLDKNNPNAKLRNVRLDQILLVKGFKYDAGSDSWVGGEIYDPEDGKTYSCKLKFETATKLKVRGYVGIPAFGKTLIWEKQ